MTNERIFTGFDERNAALWDRAPQRLGHRLHQSELFGMEALAGLLDACRREHYSLVHSGARTERRDWREGELGGLSGRQVLEAVSKGPMWIHLLDLPAIDARYGAVLDGIFAELKGHMPGFDAFTRKMGLLISSPGSRTPYHVDLPGMTLWQLHGSKRFYVYPAAKPFLTPEHVEDIALSGVETTMPYEPWFDEHAQVFDLEPGQMLHWPLNAPHRVDNHDCLNVSMTLEHFTDGIRREHIVTVANAIMRTKLGIAPRTHLTTGPSFYAKAVLQKSLRHTRWARGAKRSRRPADFRLDADNPGSIVELAAAS